MMLQGTTLLAAIGAPPSWIYIAAAIVAALLILVGLEVLWKLPAAEGARTIPMVTHASYLVFLGVAVATAIIYRAATPPATAAMLRLVRDLFVLGGIVLNLAGTLWMVWPRRVDGKRGSMTKPKPMPLQEVLSLPQEAAKQQQLHRVAAAR